MVCHASRTSGSDSEHVAVHAHVVPGEAMSHAVLLGLDNWSHVPVRKYRDVGETETMVTVAGQVDQSDKSDQAFSKWAEKAVGLVEGTGSGSGIVRYAGKDALWPDHLTAVIYAITRNCKRL